MDRMSDEQIDAAIEALFPNDNHYHEEWMQGIARPIARAILSAAGGERQEPMANVKELMGLVCEFGVLRANEGWEGRINEAVVQIYNAIEACAKRLVASPVPADQQAMEGQDAKLCRAYEAGWNTAANWMERDDLKADTNSPAYIADRDAALAAMKEQP